MSKTMSQKAAREGLGNPVMFSGGAYITKNGVAELFVQTAVEREAELTERNLERQSNALLKMAMLSKQEMSNGRGSSVEDVLQRRRAART